MKRISILYRSADFVTDLSNLRIHVRLIRSLFYYSIWHATVTLYVCSCSSWYITHSLLFENGILIWINHHIIYCHVYKHSHDQGSNYTTW